MRIILLLLPSFLSVSVLCLNTFCVRRLLSAIKIILCNDIIVQEEEERNYLPRDLCFLFHFFFIFLLVMLNHGVAIYTRTELFHLLLLCLALLF